MIHAAFVAPYLPPTTLRFVRAAATLPEVRLALITQDPVERLPGDLRELLSAHWRVDDTLDWRQLVTAGRGLSSQLGGLDRIVGVLEHAQVAIARARAELGIDGLTVEAALNFRDKARMKTVLRESGLPCAHHQLATDRDQAVAFAERLGFPLVLKPPAGAGAKGTFRVDDRRALEEALAWTRPSPDDPLLLEEFVVGEEHSLDSVFLHGRPVWFSRTSYLPGPLEVLRNAWIQWCVLLPREVDDPAYADIREAAFEANSVLGLRTGLSHLEWFRRPDRSLAISEVAARPPGAQIVSLMSYAHDLDFYRAWARLMIREEFEPPERRYAAGAAYLRGMGRGRVVAVHGIDRAQREVGDVVVEAHLPSPGQPVSDSYEGDGYVIVRHPETRVVEAALRTIVSTLRVELEE